MVDKIKARLIEFNREIKMIRIMIVDDHALFRQTLRTIIDKQEDMHVVVEASNGIEALEKARKHRPDIILMDISMPLMDGIDATRRISASLEDVKIIALTSHSEEIFNQKMQEAGAADYLSKICNQEELVDCIRTVWHTRTGP